MEHFYQGIPGWFNFQSLYSRMVREFADGAVFVEIGSLYGRSTAYMAVEILNSGKSISLLAIDTWMGSPEHDNKKDMFPQFSRNMLPVAGLGILDTMQTDSVKAATAFSPRSFEFVYIDAAHDYDSVKADIHAWWPIVKIGGYIGGHDYSESWPGVVRAVDEFFSDKGAFETFDGSWLYRKDRT